MKTLNDVKKTLTDYMEDYSAKIELWKNVKRVYKKDGKEFSVLSKNFENATICNIDYSIREDKEIRVSGRINGVYVYDSIEIYPCVDTYKHDVDEARIIKRSFLNPYFIMTVDEIEIAIADRIEMYEGYVKDLKDQLDKADDVFMEFKIAIDKAMDKMRKEAGNNTSLYYETLDYLKSVY